MKRARGAALLLALWAIALLAALLAGLAVSARGEGEAARNVYAQARARYAAEAGLARAIAALREAHPAQRWIPDGRIYRFGFGGAQVSVRVTDASGKIDLNAAPGTLLANLFRAAGADMDRAQALADAVQDWRDSDDLTRAHGAEADTYRHAGLAWLPRNGPFRTPDELVRVYGMDGALYRKVADAVTVYSGRNLPDPAYAGVLTLAALRNGDPVATAAEVAARRARPAQPLAGDGIPPGRTGNVPSVLVAGSGGLTQDIRSQAVFPDGTRVALDATVRLIGAGGGSRPYTVLGWDNVSEDSP